MTFEAYMRIFVALAALIALPLVARDIVRGRTKFSGETYARSTQPADYWREIGLQLFMLSMLAVAVIAWRPPDELHPYSRHLHGVFPLAIFAPLLIRAVWTRNVSLGYTQLGRTGRSGPYWAFTIILAALTVYAITMIVLDWPG